MASGRTIPVETVYVGVVDGMHQWDAVAPLGWKATEDRPASLLIAQLPAHTSVGIPVEWWG